MFIRELHLSSDDGHHVVKVYFTENGVETRYHGANEDNDGVGFETAQEVVEWTLAHHVVVDDVHGLCRMIEAAVRANVAAGEDWWDYMGFDADEE